MAKKNKKQTDFVKFIITFSLTFVFALFIITVVAKKMSPSIDIQIAEGSSKLGSFDDNSDSDDFSNPSLDERLKWIQFEDNGDNPADEHEIKLPQFFSDDKNSRKEKDDNISAIDNTPSQVSYVPVKSSESPKQEPQPVVPKIAVPTPVRQNMDSNVAVPLSPKLNEISKSFNTTPTINIHDNSSQPQTIQSTTKVYVGFYDKLESALDAKSVLQSSNPDLSPIVKSVNGQYIVQMGSFSDHTKAVALKNKLTGQGYAAKMISN